MLRIDTRDDNFNVNGLSGLKNIGNTCYMNAVIQCLGNIPILNRRLTNNYKSVPLGKSNGDNFKLNPDGITYNLARVLDTMWSENGVVIPEAMKLITSKMSKEFVGFGQNDSQELLCYIIDALHEENKSTIELDFSNINNKIHEYVSYINKCKSFFRISSNDIERTKILMMMEEHGQRNPVARAVYNYQKYIKNNVCNNYSFVSSDIMGNYYSRVICLNCRCSYDMFEPFTTLSLNTELSDMTLNESLNNLTRDEHLKGDNKYYCNNCSKKVEAVRQLYIWSAPIVLIIHLRRFVSHRGRPTKTEAFIKFPLDNFDISDNTCKINPTGGTYKLYGVIEHHGSCGGGHYIANCRNYINDKWYRFNDSNVQHIPEDRVEKDVVNHKAYVLFYVKK